MVVIQKKKKTLKRITGSIRLRPDMVKKIEKIACDMDESRTYVLESLLDYAVEAYEKEKKKKGQAKSGRSRSDGAKPGA